MKKLGICFLAGIFWGCVHHDAPTPSVAPIQADSAEIKRNVDSAKSDLQKIEDEADKMGEAP